MGGETRRAKSLRIGVHHADAVVWEPVYRTRLIRSVLLDVLLVPLLRVVPRVERAHLGDDLHPELFRLLAHRDRDVRRLRVVRRPYRALILRLSSRRRRSARADVPKLAQQRRDELRERRRLELKGVRWS